MVPFMRSPHGKSVAAQVAEALVTVACSHAREAGCEWLHVDFEDHLARFYFGSCGFRPTQAGLIRLR